MRADGVEPGRAGAAPRSVRLGDGRGFRPDESDLDFLVDFEPPSGGAYRKTYFGLLNGLRELFGRPVDLVDASAVRNPYFREASS